MIRAIVVFIVIARMILFAYTFWRLQFPLVMEPNTGIVALNLTDGKR